MNLEHILFYATHHSETIIQWLFLAILLLTLAVIGKTLFGKKTSDGVQAHAGGALAGMPAASNPEIQGFLEKILQQTAKLEAVSLDKMNPTTAAETDAKIQALKKDLASREDELAKAKAGGDSQSSEAADKLAARIKELESKLAEYEILEDDIADLSLYKEENARLRAELDKNKAAAGGAPAPAAVAEQMASAPAPASGEDIVAEFAEAVTQKTVSAAGPTVEVPASGDPMADFESAMNLEKKFLNEEKAATPSAAPAAAAAVAPATAAASAAPQGEGDDLFAEFATPPAAEPEPAAAAPAEGGLDTDKMMAEMAALVSVEPSPGGSALEDTIDTEKMALEATNLHKA